MDRRALRLCFAAAAALGIHALLLLAVSVLPPPAMRRPPRPQKLEVELREVGRARGAASTREESGPTTPEAGQRHRMPAVSRQQPPPVGVSSGAGPESRRAVPSPDGQTAAGNGR